MKRSPVLEAVVDQMAAAYYLDDRLSLAESTCTFPANGLGRENVREEFYVVAIRGRGSNNCLFRFSEPDRAGALSMLETLNRRAAEAATWKG